jgi:hypothetical protein
MGLTAEVVLFHQILTSHFDYRETRRGRRVKTSHFDCWHWGAIQARRTHGPTASGRPTRSASRSNVVKRPPWGEDDRHLGVAQGKAGKAPLPLHDVTKVLKDAAEALVEDAKLDRFAAVESNTLRIFRKRTRLNLKSASKRCRATFNGTNGRPILTVLSRRFRPSQAKLRSTIRVSL